MVKDIKIVMNSTGRIINDLGFGRRNKVQIFVDNEIRKGMDKYIPMDTGTMKNSVNSSRAGSGQLVYNTSYAKTQFYNGRNVEGDARGRLWSERYAKLEGKALAERVQAYIRSIT